MRTRFILIEPSHAGNVGATARAMKVMGFDDLVMVRPRWDNVLRREETIQRASGALDVLNGAKIVDTFDAAIEGIEHLCATAMTPRDFGANAHAPRERLAWLALQAGNQLLLNSEQQTQWIPRPSADLSNNLAQNGDFGPSQTPALASVAFVFGTERYGMANEDVYRCHSVITIPSNPKFGSLNLAAAVQVMAYEWRTALGGYGVPELPANLLPKLASADAVQGLLKHLEQALVHVDYMNPAEPKKLMPRLNQIFNRAALREEEIHILRGVAKAILKMKPPAAITSPD